MTQNKLGSFKGISLISLIITIIVIIILAMIVIFNTFGTTKNSQFAKFSQEFSSYQEEMHQKFLDAKRQISMEKESKTDSEIYAEIAGTLESGDCEIDDVLGGKMLSEEVNGIHCYKIQDAKNFYGDQTSIYITDKGELLTVPGYAYTQNGEARRYINSRKYYIESAINTSGENEDSDEGIRLEKDTLDSGDSSAEMWELLGVIANEISNTKSIDSDSDEATVSLRINGNNKTYTIKVGDTFKVNSTVAGYKGDKVVRVMGFKHDILTDPEKAYGEGTDATLAGISFEFVEFLMKSKMHSAGDNLNGWVEKDIYEKLNSGENAAWEKLSNSGEIKEVSKTYITKYNTGLTSTSNDKLWLLACSEIWNNGVNSNCSNGYAKKPEGKQYKYYKIIDADSATGEDNLKKYKLISSISSSDKRLVASFTSL